MAISAADVKKLRDQTGAGMMDCKKALTESGGEFDKALKILKELGLAAAAKRSDRDTDEGRVFVKEDGSKAVILEIGCETDFVARNKDFIAYGEKMLDTIAEKGLKEVNDDLNTMVQEAISIIKENIAIGKFENISIAEDELAATYVHGEGSIGVIVKAKLEKPELKDNEEVKQFVFDTALHVAAFNPLYLDESKVEAGYLKEQEEIFTVQAKNLGKPENVVQGIVKGKLGKHLSEICLMKQPFVKDDKRSVEKVAADLSASAGGTVSISDYVYYSVGS